MACQNPAGTRPCLLLSFCLSLWSWSLKSTAIFFLNFALLGEHDSFRLFFCLFFCLFFSKAQTRASKDGSTHPMLRDLLETHYGSHQFCISKKNILPAHVWSPICTKFKAPEVMSLQYLKSKLRKCWSMSWENLIGLWHIFLSFKLHVSLGVQFQYIYIYIWMNYVLT